MTADETRNLIAAQQHNDLIVHIAALEDQLLREEQGADEAVEVGVGEHPAEAVIGPVLADGGAIDGRERAADALPGEGIVAEGRRMAVGVDLTRLLAEAIVSIVPGRADRLAEGA